jgi:DAACS family dicarboxylate/amino acid:cation (Na+ or H+) symporter
MPKKVRLYPRSLHNRIMLGLVIGAAAGVAANLYTTAHPAYTIWVERLIRYGTGPLGQIFLSLLFMTVVPLVFATLSTGVAHLGDLRKLGRIGIKTFAFFCLLTALATTIGMIMVTTFQPGHGFDPDTQARLLESYQGDLMKRSQSFEERGGFGIETVIKIIPSNPLSAMVNMDMLAVICFALLVGAGLTRLREERRRPLVGVLEALADLMIVLVDFAMRLAPFAVPALIFNVTARFGAELLEKLLGYVLVVFGGYALFLFGVYPLLLWGLSRRNPLTFFRRAVPILVTGFSTSSSNATLPTTLKVAEEELDIPPDIAGFVLPLGATMNMNGTALYEGVTVLFLAQVFGVHLTMGDQVLVVLMSVLMAIGTAGIPGASLPMIMLVLATVGVRPEGIAIILGVDRILDMGRTVLNVTGDVVTATYITRSETRSGRRAEA